VSRRVCLRNERRVLPARVCAGYVSARLYKSFFGEHWKTNVLMTCFLIFGVIFGIFFLIDLVLFYHGSSAAVPYTTIIVLLLLWFGLSAPLTFVGAYLGFRQPVPENPVRTNQIPRQIPDQVFYMRALPSILMGGTLPFGAIFIELYFIVTSLWYHHVYYVFGFLFVVFLILVITCSEVSILLCYFQLCAEDYRWWWRAFLTPAATGLYLFLYCVFYYTTKLEVEGLGSAIVFFGYALIMCVLFALMTGAIGFAACLVFVRKIYGALKVD
jgi:transmembrane 9 superfamily member 2/4